MANVVVFVVAQLPVHKKQTFANVVFRLPSFDATNRTNQFQIPCTLFCRILALLPPLFFFYKLTANHTKILLPFSSIQISLIKLRNMRKEANKGPDCQGPEFVFYCLVVLVGGLTQIGIQWNVIRVIYRSVNLAWNFSFYELAEIRIHPSFSWHTILCTKRFVFGQKKFV